MMQPSNSFDAILPAPFGALGVRIQAEVLTELVFLPPGTPPTPIDTPFLDRVREDLMAYFAHPGHRFTLPARARGTPFRETVWHALEQIPVGHTVTYGELAKRLGSAPRAIGQAVGDNPLPILIPCHRVIAAGGGLGGFNHSRTGYTQDIKRWLLAHEGAL